MVLKIELDEGSVEHYNSVYKKIIKYWIGRA